jgi:DNA-binding LacI/PurR family transcriptional regulator
MPYSTVRSIAAALGVSRTTVSSALRNSPGVTAATTLRVQRAAEAMGYHRNPLAGTIMSELRRSRTSTFQGTLAAVEMVEPERPGDGGGYRQAMLRGLKRRAMERGFVVEHFRVESSARSLRRLDAILQARGIRGLILLPVRSLPDLSALDWSRYAAVYTDYLIEQPAIPSIHPDRYRSMMALLARLSGLGYERPGLMLVGDDDQRVQHHWEGALLAYQTKAGRPAAAVPVLKLGAPERTVFNRWFRSHRPDVVLGLDPQVISWILASGGAVPERQGFVCLNLLGAPAGCAGLDLQPEIIGAGAVDLVTPSLYRNELGLPAIASTTAVPARWVDGASVRTQPPSGVPAAPFVP